MEVSTNKQTTSAVSNDRSLRPALVSTPVDGKSISEVYLRRVAISGDRPMFLVKKDGKYGPVTWNEAFEQVLGVFHSLRKAGIGAGDRVCILSGSSAQWSIADQACLALGAAAVPVYQSSAIDDVGYILKHCGAKLVFAEDDSQVAKLEVAFAQRDIAIPVVWMASAPKPERKLRTIPWAEFSALEKKDRKKVEEEFRKSVDAVTPDTMASIVYTSGTTGQPKGAVLRHRHFASELRAVISSLDFRSDDVTLAFLPFAHIFGRVESYAGIYGGVTLGFAESVNSVAANIIEVRPTVLVSVPRIYEKIYAKIQTDVENGGPAKKAIFRWATDVGRAVARLKADDRPLPVLLALRYKVADQLVFSKVRAKLGGRLRFAVSGGAPLARELAEFFHACGIYVLEGYGLTETTAAVTLNRFGGLAFGSVGRTMDGAEVKIASDGEVLLRGGMVFDGYFDNAEATREALSDGWFHTGDIGEVDGRGFLRITDRKKEIIVTSGGKNIAPQKLENLLKGRRLISNAMVCGDKQKFLAAIITLNEPDAMEWAKSEGHDVKSIAELAKHDALTAFIAAQFKAVNGELASFETIKKFTVVACDFTVESGELTPSLKLKRRIVAKKYEKEIASMFS